MTPEQLLTDPALVDKDIWELRYASTSDEDDNDELEESSEYDSEEEDDEGQEKQQETKEEAGSETPQANAPATSAQAAQ